MRSMCGSHIAVIAGLPSIGSASAGRVRAAGVRVLGEGVRAHRAEVRIWVGEARAEAEARVVHDRLGGRKRVFLSGTFVPSILSRQAPSRTVPAAPGIC